MCGIAGIHHISVQRTERPSEAVLNAMADQLIHRGPDECGLHIDGPLGFAHRRLSIIDLATGQQPMLSRDKTISIVFNGEIFNFVELRRELEKKGYRFATRSDTEVIIHLYCDRGLEFPKYMNGQFSIALWDSRKRRLVLVRDRIGICPLFYTVADNRLIFASEIKALKPAMTNGLQVSARSLDQIFTFWAPVSPNTVFKDVYEISPGHMMIVENGAIRQEQYWDWDYTDEYRNDSEQQLIGELHELLIDATKIRLRSDVPVGAYLSGGLDSSALVALIHKYGKIPLRTFSLNFQQDGYDEAQFQNSLIKHLGTEHSSLVVRPEDIAAAFVSTIRHTECPILRTAPVPMGLLSGLVRQHNFKVVLAGEGADEALGGYDIFKEAKVRQFWARNPDSSWRPLLLKRLYPYLTLPDGNQGVYLKRFFGEILDKPELVYFSHAPRWATTAKAKLFFSSELNNELDTNAMDTMLASLPEKINHYHPFHRAQYIESKSLMSGYLLSSQGDRMLMKNSVEGRFPFLDHRVIEFANKLHPRIKMKAMNEKYILKKAMSPYIPGDIINRSKQPYRAPDVNASADGLLSGELSGYLDHMKIQDSGFFDPKKVSLLVKKASSGKGLTISESQALTGILSTQIIQEHFVE
jgi:asparagine synthase (glutamine-hydrolysing)